MTHERTLVIGVGNPLMRDEGVGPRVAELLAAYDFGENTEVADAGTMGLSILDLLVGVDNLVIVDAARDTGTQPGTVLVLLPDELADSQVMHSLHDMRIPDVLQNAALLDRTPRTVIVAVQIESIENWVLELSPAVEAALPVAVEAVLSQLSTWGVTPLGSRHEGADAEIIAAVRTFAPISTPDATSEAAERRS